jgi:hypothetical protein
VATTGRATKKENHHDDSAVDDIDDVVARLRARGAELLGELAQYEDSHRLCYVRGPEGIVVAADLRPTRTIRWMDRERQREE